MICTLITRCETFHTSPKKQTPIYGEQLFHYSINKHINLSILLLSILLPCKVTGQTDLVTGYIDVRSCYDKQYRFTKLICNKGTSYQIDSKVKYKLNVRKCFNWICIACSRFYSNQKSMFSRFFQDAILSTFLFCYCKEIKYF